jgi:hypothetical protein
LSGVLENIVNRRLYIELREQGDVLADAIDLRRGGVIQIAGPVERTRAVDFLVSEISEAGRRVFFGGTVTMTMEDVCAEDSFLGLGNEREEGGEEQLGGNHPGK